MYNESPPKLAVIPYDPGVGATNPVTEYAPVELVVVGPIIIGGVVVKVIVLELIIVPVVESFSVPVTLYVLP